MRILGQSADMLVAIFELAHIRNDLICGNMSRAASNLLATGNNKDRMEIAHGAQSAKLLFLEARRLYRHALVAYLTPDLQYNSTDNLHQSSFTVSYFQYLLLQLANPAPKHFLTWPIMMIGLLTEEVEIRVAAKDWMLRVADSDWLESARDIALVLELADNAEQGHKLLMHPLALKGCVF